MRVQNKPEHVYMVDTEVISAPPKAPKQTSKGAPRVPCIQCLQTKVSMSVIGSSQQTVARFV